MKTTAIFGALVALGIATAPGKLSAQSNQWTNLGPEGGSVLSIVVDPQDSSIVYAATRVGLFKSHNHGANWAISGLIGYVVDRLAVDPHDSNSIYASTNGHAFKSSDDGRTWSQLDLGGSCCIEGSVQPVKRADPRSRAGCLDQP